MCSVVIFSLLRQKCQESGDIPVLVYKQDVCIKRSIGRYDTEWRWVCTLLAEFLSTESGMQLLPSASQAPWCGRWQRENCWRGVAAPFSFTHLDGDLVRCTVNGARANCRNTIMQKSFFLILKSTCIPLLFLSLLINSGPV